MNTKVKQIVIASCVGALLVVSGLLAIGYWWGYRSPNGMRIKQDEVQHYESVIQRLKSSQVSEIGDKEKIIALLRQERDSLEKEITRLKGVVDEKDSEMKRMILRHWIVGVALFLFAFLVAPVIGWVGKRSLEKQTTGRHEGSENA